MIIIYRHTAQLSAKCWESVHKHTRHPIRDAAQWRPAQAEPNFNQVLWKIVRKCAYSQLCVPQWCDSLLHHHVERLRATCLTCAEAPPISTPPSVPLSWSGIPLQTTFRKWAEFSGMGCLIAVIPYHANSCMLSRFLVTQPGGRQGLLRSFQRQLRFFVNQIQGREGRLCRNNLEVSDLCMRCRRTKIQAILHGRAYLVSRRSYRAWSQQSFWYLQDWERQWHCVGMTESSADPKTRPGRFASLAWTPFWKHRWMFRCDVEDRA